MIFSYNNWSGRHIIDYSPKVWRRIFEVWGDAAGMNLDPSHLIWQFIDQSRFIKEFGPQMSHVHTKDVMIDRDGFYENGVMSAGMGGRYYGYADPATCIGPVSSLASIVLVTMGRVPEFRGRCFGFGENGARISVTLGKDIWQN